MNHGTTEAEKITTQCSIAHKIQPNEESHKKVQTHTEYNNKVKPNEAKYSKV